MDNLLNSNLFKYLISQKKTTTPYPFIFSINYPGVLFDNMFLIWFSYLTET